MRRQAQTGWLDQLGGCLPNTHGVVFLINTTPALRATPPHLRRGV